MKIIIACLCFAFILVFVLVSAWIPISAAVTDDAFVDEDPSCLKNFTGDSGKFDLNQKDDFKGVCYWNIQPAASTKPVVLYLTELFLNDGDNVTFYKSLTDAMDGSSPLFDPITKRKDSIILIPGELEIVVKLEGSITTKYERKFAGLYHNKDCNFPVPPTVLEIGTPIYASKSTTTECTYAFNNNDSHHDQIPAIVFKKFSLSSTSTVNFEHSIKDGLYTNEPPMDIFPDVKQTVMNMKINIDKAAVNDSFLIDIHYINPACSFYKTLQPGAVLPISSPMVKLDNGSVTTECRWIFHTKDNTGVLGIDFQKLEFDSVLDVVAINNGESELSPPLMQVTASNNYTSKQIRSAGPYLWISFKPESFTSNFSANITLHGQGGYMKGSGDVKMTSTDGNDTVFLLEVDKGQVVALNFSITNFKSPATLQVYSDFRARNLLTTLHGDVWYPIISGTSKMMIVATNFKDSSFTADFKGIQPNCLHMSTFDTDSYILSGNCNNTCTWVIPPQDVPNSELLLHLQYLSLDENDRIEILRLDDKRTHLGTILPNVTHVPILSIPAAVGAYVEVTRGACKKNTSEVALVGHVSYVPACKSTLNPLVATSILITSPNYPDTYPLLSNCIWDITVPKDHYLYLSFQKLQLISNHCIKLTETQANKTSILTGNALPGDMLFKSGAHIEFDSSSCEKSEVSEILKSGEGFVLNATVADCGNSLNNKTGKFSTADVKNSLMCFWRINVPPKEADNSVNVIIFSMVAKDNSENYALTVYDGASTREIVMGNLTSSVWSRTNNLVVVYKRLDASLPAAAISFSYETMSCNTSMQCKNGMCMHPDWKCNRVDNCGDFSDELDCGSGPPPPPVIKNTGITPTTFAVTIIAFFVLGIVLAIFIPVLYQKYKNGRYHRFGEISVIE